MTKKLVLACSLWMTGFVAIAQDRMPPANTYSDAEPATGFAKQNLFVGGGLGLGFSSFEFSIGVNPEVGYSLNKWLDAGLLGNFTYNSIQADPYYNNNIASKQFIYGGGVFMRAWFLPFLFVTVQPENNWISISQQDYKLNVTAASVLGGVGYGSRAVGQGTFYIALMYDLLRNTNSPYNDAYGHGLPVLRAGFDVFVHKQR